MIDHSFWEVLVDGGLIVVVVASLYLLMAALGLWGLFQLLTGKGRWPKDTNRGLGLVKLCVAISSLGLPVLVLAFGLLWAGLEWRLRRS